MNEATTDIIVARSRDVDRLSTMVLWSVVAHVVVTAIVMLVPKEESDLTPKAVMTINLGGAPGPRTGTTQMAARPVQAPESLVKRAETAPAPKPPAMTLPDPKSKPQAAVKNAPKDAASKSPTTGPQLTEGTARSSERKRGQGFGLSGGGGGDSSGVTLDVADFCCPEYIIGMKEAIVRNWNENQGRVGVTTMMFTIRKDGRIEGIRVEKKSGFPALDEEAARALSVTRLDALPGRYPNPTLTVHLLFKYSN